MFLNIVIAIGNKGQIGLNNSIPWKLKDDLEFFKNLTLNHIVIFGRKTFESIGKPLSNRLNVILTKNKNYKQENCLIFNNIIDLIDFIKNKNEKIFICGGAKIYKYFLDRNLINKVYVTKVDYNGDADTFIELLNFDKWKFKKIKTIEINNNNNYNASIYESNILL